MFTPPNPGVLDELIRERQRELRKDAARRPAPAERRLRVRVGRALIVAGSALSGERVETPARSHALPRAA